jgi:hypothetical protein
MNRKNADRKPRATCVLKNLGPNLQEALFEYADGVGDENGHTYAQCVIWLKKQGVETNNTQLCNWRKWYIQRLRFRWCQETVELMIEDDLENGQKYSDDEIQRKGNRMFSLMAIRTCDDKAWSRAQSLVVRRQRLALIERKMEFELKKYDDQRAKAKAVESEPEMTADEKQERIRQILGTE